MPDGGSISGHFISANHCTGTLEIAEESSGRLTKHYFDLIPEDDTLNILSASKVFFTINGVNHEFTQNDNFYCPYFDNVNVGDGYLVRSSFKKPGSGNANDLPIIWINAGRIASAVDITEMFSPGIK